MASPAPVQTAALSSSGPAVQREEMPEEEELQGSFVQREVVQREDAPVPEVEEEPVQGLFVQREGEEEEEEIPA
jgi:hypothetical protein